MNYPAEQQPSEPSATITTRVSLDLLEQLRVVSEREDRSVSWLVRKSVEAFLEASERPAS